MADPMIGANFPEIPSQLVDNSGSVTPGWQQFFVNLWQRTGSGTGNPSSILDQIGNDPGDLLFRDTTTWQVTTVSGVLDKFLGSAPGDLLFRSPSAWAAGSLTATLDSILDNTPGDLIYRNATAWTFLRPGTIGQVLTVDGGSLPKWSSVGPVGYLFIDNFGAVPGGAFDSAPALQAAIASLNGSSGVIVFGPGRYLFSNISIDLGHSQNITLRGWGNDTELFFPFGGLAMRYDTQAISSVWSFGNATEFYDLTFVTGDAFGFDGVTISGPSSPSGLPINSTLFRNVKFKGAIQTAGWNHGILLSSIPQVYIVDCSYFGAFNDTSRGEAVRMVGTATVSSAEIYVSNLVVNYGNTAVRVEANSTVVTVTKGKFINVKFGVFQTTPATQLSVTDNTINLLTTDSSFGRGVRFSGTNSIVTGNTITIRQDNCIGIYATAASGNNISNNNLMGPGASKANSGAIFIDGSGQNNLVFGNYIQGFTGTGGFNIGVNPGSNNQIFGNRHVDGTPMVLGATSAFNQFFGVEEVLFDVSVTRLPDATSGTAQPTVFDWYSHEVAGIDAGAGFVVGTGITHTFGGTGTKGGRIGLLVGLDLLATTDAANTNRNYVGLQSGFTCAVPDGGTDIHAGAQGALFGRADQSFAQAGATNFLALTCDEADLVVDAAASARYIANVMYASKVGSRAGDYDACISVGGQAGNIGWTFGLAFTDINGGLPTFSGTTLIGSFYAAHGIQTVTNGIDFTGFFFSNHAFASAGITVDGAGYIASKGTSTNDNALAGNLGEYFRIVGSATPLTSGVTAATVSQSLTAGDWDVGGLATFVGGAATTVTLAWATLNTVSAVDGPDFTYLSLPRTAGIANAIGTSALVTKRFSLATTTSVFVNAGSNFSGGTGVNCTGTLFCRRVR